MLPTQIQGKFSILSLFVNPAKQDTNFAPELITKDLHRVNSCINREKDKTIKMTEYNEKKWPQKKKQQ